METTLPSVGIFALLGLGMLFGLKHATEVDHVVAVSTIVSQHRSVMRSALVGAMWGLGHTLALLVTGILVLSLRVAIPDSVSNWLEFAVALMIIGLGVSAVWKALRKSSEIHLHQHEHDGLTHSHVHFHDSATSHRGNSTSKHSHDVRMIGIKPVIIGAIHGLAGSGALTLLVLTQIQSPWVGLAYLGVFGLGSVAGMLLMSGLIGLPFALTARNLTAFHHHLQTVAGVLSICFGVWYAYETGVSALF